VLLGAVHYGDVDTIMLYIACMHKYIMYVKLGPRSLIKFTEKLLANKFMRDDLVVFLVLCWHIGGANVVQDYISNVGCIIMDDLLWSLF